jgi:hypothetical protein
MADFAPTNVSPYRHTLPPNVDKSREEYLDQQLRSLERSIQSLVDATKQLQEEIDLIWSVAGPRP